MRLEFLVASVGIMVSVMTTILAFFFVGIDTVFDSIVHYLLSLAG